MIIGLGDVTKVGVGKTVELTILVPLLGLSTGGR